MICLSEGFLCLVLSSWAICLASRFRALWVVFRSSCVDTRAPSNSYHQQQQPFNAWHVNKFALYVDFTSHSTHCVLEFSNLKGWHYNNKIQMLKLLPCLQKTKGRNAIIKSISPPCGHDINCIHCFYFNIIASLFIKTCSLKIAILI